MLIQSIYNEPPEALLDFIQADPLGIFTTGIQSTLYPNLQSNHLPWVHDRSPISDSNDTAPKAILRGHIARANPQCKVMIDSLASYSVPILENEVMVLFNGPCHHYVTPKFYTETVSASGKAAGTWNYVAVQVYGKATVYFDANSEETKAFLKRQLQDLSDQSERVIMGYTGEGGKEKPWDLDGVLQGYMNILEKGIVGIEISIGRIEGKFKMSQEKEGGDRDGVIRGFERLGTEAAGYVVRTVRGFGEKNHAAKK
ncbi:transcriptional regulator PAI 2-type [Aspergillus cavernicola]|uniref:Transcriptional regulator PAI 2-type n=1 Tax=Aspergillus cavernicola TaxID=176166 RepID=A0ABR4IN60_9EURO